MKAQPPPAPASRRPAPCTPIPPPSLTPSGLLWVQRDCLGVPACLVWESDTGSAQASVVSEPLQPLTVLIRCNGFMAVLRGPRTRLTADNTTGTTGAAPSSGLVLILLDPGDHPEANAPQHTPHVKAVSTCRVWGPDGQAPRQGSSVPPQLPSAIPLPLLLLPGELTLCFSDFGSLSGAPRWHPDQTPFPGAL